MRVVLLKSDDLLMKMCLHIVSQSLFSLGRDGTIIIKGEVAIKRSSFCRINSTLKQVLSFIKLF